MTTDRSQVLPSHMQSDFLSNILSSWESVQVTPEDIANGERGNGKNCPIVLAAKRVYPWLTEMDISGAEPYFINQSGRRVALHMVPEAVAWVGCYDREEPVEPIHFRMNLS